MKKRTILRLFVLVDTIIMLALSKAADNEEKKMDQERKNAIK